MDGGPKDHGRILVVDDDSSICGLISDIVEDLGLEAVCVHTDADAYARLRTLPTFRALLVDINLGTGTTGFDIARFARQIVPDIPVLYVSGETSRTSFAAFGVRNSDFIAKPFAADDILNPLRARLGL